MIADFDDDLARHARIGLKFGILLRNTQHNPVGQATIVAMASIAADLALSRPPVAVGFFNTPPSGIERWDGAAVPAGCRFWRLAAEGRSFYTEPEHHYNCAVGSHTHGIGLPASRGNQLQDTIGFMVSSGYIEMAEVPGIPVLSQPPKYVAYGPLPGAPFEPDVVLVCARPYAAMLLYEAALRAGAGNALTNVIGRPGCAVLPLTANTGSASLSFGCKGNRTFTGLPEEEMYFAVPGAKWDAVSRALDSILSANAAMESYYKEHEQRVAQAGAQ